MSYKAMIYNNGISKTIYANEYYLKNSFRYSFYCPSCNCKMNIQSRRLSNNKTTYFFYSNSHDKNKCTLYKKNNGKSIFHEGTPVINFGIFSDHSSQTKNAPQNIKAVLDNSLISKENNKTVIEFKKQNPRLNNVNDFIKWIENSSIDEDMINVGSKKKPTYKSISQILIRDDNFENYHSRNLTGIGILWGGIRCNQLKLGIKASKDSIIIQEYLPYSKFKENIKPIIFELSFSSEETKEDFANQYFKFNPKSTVLIIIGNWEKQPNQNGYKIYKSKIGKKCYTFLEYEKEEEEYEFPKFLAMED